MSEKKFKNYTALMSVIIAVAMSVSATTGNWIIGIVALIIGVFKIYQIKMRIKAKVIIEDEMVEKYLNKAARITYQIFAVSGSIIGLILISYGKANQQLLLVGNTIAFATCAIVLIFVLVYKFIIKDLKEDNYEE